MIPFTPPNTPALHIPFLHRLRVELELVRVDMPVCLLARDVAGRLYLLHVCGTCTEREREYWYVVPIDEATVPRLLSGQVSLNTSLTDVPAQHRLIGPLESRAEGIYEFSQFQLCPDLALLANCLPNPSFRFFEDEFAGYMSVELAPVADYAHRRLAEVFYLRLFGPRLLPNLLPLGHLADIGKALQRLLTNLAMFKADAANFGRRGHVVHSVEHFSQFALTGIASGSVQLRLESISPAELVEAYDVAHNGATLLSELAAPTRVSDICQVLRNYPPRIRSNFLSYVASLKNAEAGAKLQWGSPRRADKWEGTWSAEFVAETVTEVSKMAVAQEATFEATGFFVEGSMASGRFKFLDASSNRSITGHLGPDVEQDIVTLSRAAPAAVLYSVTIREVVSTTPDGGTKYDYTFLGVSDVGTHQ